MKVIIVSNCNGQAHYKFMKHFFPDWDVRLVVFSQAKQWLFQEHEGFLDFLAEADICIGAPPFFDEIAEGRFKPSVMAIHIPGYVYTGTRPDCFWLPGVTSPTGGGILHSRIAAAAYCRGKSIEQTAALFNREHFERLGYFDEHLRSLKGSRRLWGELGVDFDALFQTWWEEGDFMYTPNHPAATVLYDLLHHTLSARDLLTGISSQDLAQTRGKFDDPLSRAIFWPVYPEFVEHFQVKAPITQWRGSLALGHGDFFDLHEMITRSFATFDTFEDFQTRAEDSLGHRNIPVYSGDAPPNKRIGRDFNLTLWEKLSPKRLFRQVKNRMRRQQPVAR